MDVVPKRRGFVRSWPGCEDSAEQESFSAWGELLQGIAAYAGIEVCLAMGPCLAAQRIAIIDRRWRSVNQFVQFDISENDFWPPQLFF